jgi:hypothetical protein
VILISGSMDIRSWHLGLLTGLHAYTERSHPCDKLLSPRHSQDFPVKARIAGVETAAICFFLVGFLNPDRPCDSTDLPVCRDD